MPSTGSPQHDYELFVEQAIENYKVSVPRSALLSLGDEAVDSLRSRSDDALTELLLCDEIDRLIFRRLELPTFASWRATFGLALEAHPAFVDAAGNALTSEDPNASPILSVAEGVGEELIAALSENPKLMYQLDPQKFEELVAELLHRQGAQVSVTATSRDGGRDIVARIVTPFGACLCLVECKRYSPDRPVSVHAVRQLYGVVSQARATQGLLVTTSRFTKPALDFVERIPHQISLKAYLDVVAWLAKVRSEIAKRPA